MKTIFVYEENDISGGSKWVDKVGFTYVVYYDNFADAKGNQYGLLGMDGYWVVVRPTSQAELLKFINDRELRHKE